MIQMVEGSEIGQYPRFSEVPVYTSRLAGVDGEFVKEEDFKGIMRDSDRKMVTVQSKRYALIQHEDVHRQFMQALGYIPNRHTIDTKYNEDETRMYVNVRFDGMNFQPRAGDVIEYGLQAINSVDGSIRIMVIPYTMRLACSNGMTHMEKMGSLQRKHIGNVQEVMENMSGIVREGVNQLTHIQSQYAHWAATPVQKAVAIQRMEQTKGIPVPKKYIKEINSIPIETEWDVFNALTQMNWHDDKRNIDAKIGFNKTIMAVMRNV